MLTPFLEDLLVNYINMSYMLCQINCINQKQNLKSRVYALYMILNRLVNESHHPNEVENDACQNSSDSHLISKSTPKILRYLFVRDTYHTDTDDNQFSIVIPRPISIPDSLPCQLISIFIILSVYVLKAI